MKSVKSFRIDDILVGSQSPTRKRRGEVDGNRQITTVKATREEEIVKVVEDDDDVTPSISPVLRNKLAEKRKEKKFVKRGKMEEGHTSTTSDDSGNSSRSSTPTDLSITSTAALKAKTSEGLKSSLPRTLTASSDEGNNSNQSKGENEKSSEGECETPPKQFNNGLGNSAAAGGTPIVNGVPMHGGSGFHPYVNHPHFPMMFPMSSSGGVPVSQEERGYPPASSLHFSAAASANGSVLVDPFLSKGRPFFGGARHPSSALISLGVPSTPMDYSMYSQHHPGYQGGYYGIPNMHDAAAAQQKVHQQQLIERLNYPASMFQINRPMYASTAAAVSAACKRKGGQIRFTNSQTAQLEQSFVSQKYLNATDRKKLAQTLGLTDRQVKTWFQNRRAKLRKCKGGVCVESEVYNQMMKHSP